MSLLRVECCWRITSEDCSCSYDELYKQEKSLVNGFQEQEKSLVNGFQGEF